MTFYRFLPLLFLSGSLLLSACPNSADDPDQERPDAGLDQDDAEENQQNGDNANNGEEPVPLELLSLSPDSGPVTGGTEVTLSGRGFMEGMVVYFGGELAPQVDRQGALSAQVITPAVSMAGTVDIIVENPDHTRFTLANAFTYLEAANNNGDNQDPDPDPVAPENCNIQFPIIARGDTHPGEEIALYGRVYQPGFTDQTELPTELVAQALVGPIDADFDDYLPLATTRMEAYIGNDFEEFEALFTPQAAGLYAYFFRFSLDGGDTWTACDLTGPRAEEDLDISTFGALPIVDDSSADIDYCRTWQTDMGGSTGAEGPIITVELYQGGITDTLDPPEGDRFEAQAGFGPAGTNPALGYDWRPITFSRLGPDNPNNYEYEGPLYLADDAPDPGQYQALTRVRPAGDEPWTYCTTTAGEPDFTFARAAELTVN